jgi:hypothetical protein
MREVGDLLVGEAALGDVLDDVDDVARFAGLVANADALRSDVATAQRLAFPEVLIQEKAVAGLQQLVIVDGDDFGGALRKQVERRLADDEIAREAELRLRHAVDQEIAAILRVLDRDLRRDVVDDLAQKGKIAVAFLLEVAPLGDVLDGGDPSALGQRPADRDEPTAVRALHDRAIDPALRDVVHDGGAEFVDVAVEEPALLAMLDQVAEMAARLRDVGRQLIHVEVAPVEGDDARGRVVQHQALDHVVERGVEPAPLGFQRCWDSRFCRLIWRMIRNRISPTTEAASRAAVTRKRVCARQSDSAAAIVLVATTTIGKRLSFAPEPSRSMSSTGLCRIRSVCWPPLFRTRCSNGALVNFFPIISSTCGWRASMVPSA